MSPNPTLHLQNNAPINPGPNLADPAVLAQLLVEDAQALDTQSVANGARNSALAGHPYPEQFYRAAAEHLRAAAKLLNPEKPVPAAAPQAEPPGAWVPGAAAPDPDKGKGKR